jgi:hypothetical protein
MMMKTLQLNWTVGEINTYQKIMARMRNMYRLLVRKPEGRRPLGRLRHRWIDNIKIDLLGIGLSVVDWIGLTQDR